MLTDHLGRDAFQWRRCLGWFRAIPSQSVGPSVRTPWLVLQDLQLSFTLNMGGVQKVGQKKVLEPLHTSIGYQTLKPPNGTLIRRVD